MKQSTVFLIGTLLSVATAIFSIWFFPFNGASLAGMVIGTGFVVLATLAAYITHLLAKEGN